MSYPESLTRMTNGLKKKRIKRKQSDILEELYDLSDEVNYTLSSIQDRLDRIIHRMEVLSDDDI